MNFIELVAQSAKGDRAVALIQERLLCHFRVKIRAFLHPACGRPLAEWTFHGLTGEFWGVARRFPLRGSTLRRSRFGWAEPSCSSIAERGTQIRIRKVGLRGATFDVILISHLHGDHVFGLPGLMSSWTLQGRTKPLVVVGPSGLEAYLRGVNASTQGNWSYPVEFRVAEPGIVYQNDDVVVRSQALKHRIETWGYRIDEVVAPRKVCYDLAVAAGLEHADFRSLQLGRDAVTRGGRVVPNSEVTTEGRSGFSMAYLSDTSFVPELAGFARDVEFLYHESTYLERHADLAHKTGHSTAGEAATLASMAGAQRLGRGQFSQRGGGVFDF